MTKWTMKIKLERDYRRGDEIDIPESEIIRAYNSRSARMATSEVKRANVMKRWEKYRKEHGPSKKVCK